MTSGSGSGHGADQHLLALLRAIRLRRAAPDAVAAGIADTAAALAAIRADDDESGHPVLPPGEEHQALPPGRPRLGLPPVPPHGDDEPGSAGQQVRPRWASSGAEPASPLVASAGQVPAPTGDAAEAGIAEAAPPRATEPPPRATEPPRAAAPPPAAEPPPPAAPASPSRSFWQRSPVRPIVSRPPATPAAADPDVAREAGPAAEPIVRRDSAERRGTAGDARPGRASPGFGSRLEHGPLVRPAGLPPAESSRLAGTTEPSHGVEPAPPGSGPFAEPERHRPAVAPPKPLPSLPPARPGGELVARPDDGPYGGPVPGSDGEPSVGSHGGPIARSGGEAAAGRDDGDRYADVEAIGRPSRNRFAGLPVRRPSASAVPGPGPVAEPTGPEAFGRPSWASGFDGSAHAGDGGHRATPRLPGFDLPHVMPPMVTGARKGNTDGMDPADDVLLRQTQRLLSTSLTFAGGPGEVAQRLRAARLQAHPSLLGATPGGPATQVDQLARALTWLVHHLDRPPVLVDGCGRLGAALAACGVHAGQLQLVGAALAEAMRAGMAPGQWRQDFDLAWRSTWQHAYEWIVHGGATAGAEPLTWNATVVEHDLRRPDLAVVRLRPHLPMPFRPGQYARIQLPELPAVWRPYSLAGAPRRNDVIELHVRAKTEGGVSGRLVHRTRAGDEIRLGPAEGAMVLPPPPGRNLLMIAGDTGVAPLKALLTELADTGDTRSAVLFWGVRNLDELYDIAEIAEIARSARRATVVPVVSEGAPGPYASGLVTDAVAAYGEWSDHEVYLAGPPLMLAATSSALRLLGVAPERIHHDAPE